MENEREFKFKCLKCGNCCKDKNTLVNLTYYDILKIKNELKLTLEEVIEILGFYVFQKKPSENELKRMVIPPIKTEKGLAFVGLRKSSNGTCYFFDDNEKKCSIYNIRPMFCKTFPFSFKIIFNKTDKRKAKIKMYLTEKAKQYCSGIGKDSPIINQDRWSKLGKKTIEQINHNNVLIKKWNDAVKEGKILPTIRNFLLIICNL